MKRKTPALILALAISLCGLPHAHAMDEFKVAPPQIPQHSFNLTDFGAVGDGKTVNSAAFAKAFAAINTAGGGRLIVPKGTFITGPLTLISHLDLHLDDGAKIQFPTDWATYAQALPAPDAAGTPPPAPVADAEPAAGDAPAGRGGRGGRGAAGGFFRGPPALIFGNNLTDVAITGPGTIDGGGQLFWGGIVAQREAALARGGAATTPPATPPPTPPAAAGPAPRPNVQDPVPPEFAAVARRVGKPRLIILQNTQRVLVQGVLLTNSPVFHLAPTLCEDVLIDGVRIKSPAKSPNTDAIDPTSCNRVIIRNCSLDAGDDNVAIKTTVGYPSTPMENILIENCACLHGHGISVGSQTYGGIQHVLVRNCTFDGGDQAIRIKSARDRGAIMGDYTFSNIQMRNINKYAITINFYYEDPKAMAQRAAAPVTASTPHLSGVTIEHVTGVDCNKACEIVGLPEAPVENITLTDVSVAAKTGAVIQDVKHVIFNNVSFKPKTGEPITINHAEDSQLTLK